MNIQINKNEINMSQAPNASFNNDNMNNNQLNMTCPEKHNCVFEQSFSSNNDN